MSIMSKTTKSLLIFSIIYSIGSYTYHTLRHYYAIKALEDNKKENIGNILIFTNIAIILSSLIGGYIQSKLSTFALALFVVILSIVSIGKEKIKYQKIEKNKLKFFILEQAKVINLSLQPLYLYLFVNSKITYVGIYNVILGISSCIFIYFFTRKVNDKKYFKYLNIIFCLFLLLKLNIYNKYLILIIGLFEGLGIKMFEIVSSENIYNIKKDTNIGGYLLLVELIFCITRSIMCLIGYLINNIKIILYLTIVLIFLVGFVKRDINKDC